METLVHTKPSPPIAPRKVCAVDAAVVLNLLYLGELLAEVMDEYELKQAVETFRQRGKTGNTGVS